MKHLFFFLFITCCVYGQDISFVALDVTGHTLCEYGQACHHRHSPCSTFKIPLSAIGYDLGILKDEHHPEYLYDGHPVPFDSWKQAQTPLSWMHRSVIWYSQLLTPQIGLCRLRHYLMLFDYGNQDLSGGLTHAWLSSSLKISPLEQTLFLHKCITNQLPISDYSVRMTKNLMRCGEVGKGWTLYGKTGGGFEITEDRKIAWFVGWIEKEQTSVVFALLSCNLHEFPTKEEQKETALLYLQKTRVL